MERLRIGALALLLASPSYAWSAPSEALLGKPLPARSASARPAPADAVLSASPPPAAPKALAKASSAAAALKTGARASLRGPNETRVYQAAAPAVVLVLSKDGVGSGALISADGQIVTNLHVVGGDDEVAVVFKPKVEGQEIGDADIRPAKVIKRDAVADLALIQVAETPAGVTPLVLGAAASVQVGADVHAIGHPTGEAWTYTRGVVSQVRKDYAWTSSGEHKATVIQTQTPINPGNSGGPLINDNLEIIGINSFKADGEGLNFAVSADDVKAFLARPADRRPVKAIKKKTCEPVDLSMEKVKDPDGVEYLVDETCDGEGDYLSFVPDDPKEAIVFYFDHDGDELIDMAIFDDDRDGDPDYVLLDTDANEKWDMQGFYRRGEEEPYRMERIKEE